MTLHAAIDQDDTNWIVVLKDVGPDVSVRTAREGERDVPTDLPERELTRGWLKASYRALDEKRSKPWKPFHKLTRASISPVTPGEVVEYASNCAVPIVHKAGDVAPEKNGTQHWWQNTGTTPVVLISVDVFPTEAAKEQQHMM